MTEDDRRVNFLLALRRSALRLTVSESGFVDTASDQFGFSQKQRVWIDKLRAKYEEKLNGQNQTAPKAQTFKKPTLARAIRDQKRTNAQGAPIWPD